MKSTLRNLVSSDIGRSMSHGWRTETSTLGMPRWRSQWIAMVIYIPAMFTAAP